MQTLSCRLCGQLLPAPLLKLPDTPLANEFFKKPLPQETFPLQLTSCSSCNHYQLNHSVDAERLFKEYIFVTGTSPVNVKYFQKYARDCVKRFNLKPGDFVLEIASNDGTLLKEFQELGMSVLGVDPATAISHKASQEGITTLPEFFTEELATEIAKQRGKAKLICANNVLAHTDSVVDIIKGIKHLLADDGVFVFENSYFKDMYEKNMPDLIYHEHMSHFLVYPLLTLFQAQEMCFFDVIGTTPHGGSIRGFVSTKPREVNHVNEFIAEERKLGLITGGDKNIKMNDWAKKIKELKQELKAKIEEYKSEGKKIAAFGAPAKFTTLSYLLDLDPKDISYIVDDNELKQGCYSPGKHIPIVSSAKLNNDKVDIIIISAWNFYSSIIENNNKYLNDGGFFIIPLPNIKTVNKNEKI
jgi:SAM-dependent methyltransferase